MKHSTEKLIFKQFFKIGGAGTRENKDGRWAGSGRRRIGMREPCEARREKNEGH